MTTPQQTLERAYAALSAAAFAHPSAADEIGTQCSEAAKELRALLATQAQGQDAAPAEQMQEFWLWKNFVDGRPEYWAFDNPYPINLTDGDPQTLGEPCGYAIFKPSRNGRPDVPRAQVIAAIKRAKE